MKKFDKCSICRRAGEKLFLKGEKCNSPKCPFLKRSYAPGDAGSKSSRKKFSDYAIQLREKQKARSIYCLSEKQMENYVKNISDKSLLEILESRIDCIVHKIGVASSQRAARQLVSHGNVYINGKKVSSSNILLKVADRISFKNVTFDAKKSLLPAYIKFEPKDITFVLSNAPKIDIKSDVNKINDQLIIEYYSR